MKTKEWYILLLLCLCISCSKNELGISYTKNEEEIKQEIEEETENTFSIIGNWKGKLYCPSCCNSEYDYKLTILSYNKSNNQVKGELKISHDYNSEWLLNSYAKYKCTGTFKEKKLTIKTTKLYKESSSSCKYCDENEYKMVLQSDHSFKGTWPKSKTCDINTETQIKLKKS